jgi:hypothetical protein
MSHLHNIHIHKLQCGIEKLIMANEMQIIIDLFCE